MKGYFKIKGNTPFIPTSNSNKEFLFLDKDFDLKSSKSTNKKPHLNEQEPKIIDHYDDDKHQSENKKKNENFRGKTEEYDDGGDHHGLKSEGGVLRRNLSVSSTIPANQKNNNIKGNNNNSTVLERQSSTRSIQGAVKRAFSIKRSSSVNHDRYCRIYDQPMNVDDNDTKNCDYVYDDDVDDDDHHHHDFERNVSLKTRSVKKLDNNGRRHVGSKVVRACKRLFSR